MLSFQVFSIEYIKFKTIVVISSQFVNPNFLKLVLLPPLETIITFVAVESSGNLSSI